MGEENQGNALSIDGDFTALRDKLIDIERFNRFFYEAANLILQDKDDDKIAYGAYVFSLQAKKLFNELDDDLCQLQQKVIAVQYSTD